MYGPLFQQDSASGGGLVNLALVTQIVAQDRYRNSGEHIDVVGWLSNGGGIDLLRDLGDRRFAELCIDVIADTIRQITTGERTDPIIDAIEVRNVAGSSFPVGRKQAAS